MGFLRPLGASLRDDLTDPLRPGVERGGAGGLDRLVALGLLLVCFLAYLPLARAVVESRILDHHNQVFDLDPGRWVDLWAEDEGDATTFATDVRVKHPGALLLAPPVKALMALGFSGRWAATILVLLCGAAMPACGYLLLRALGVRLAEALCLAVVLAAAATQLTAASVVETYGPAGLTVAWVLVITARRLRDPGARPRSRLPIALVAFAITSTNVLQAGWAEVVLRLREGPPGRALVRIGSYALLLLVPMGIGGLYALKLSPLDLLDNPVAMVQEAWWVGNLQEETPKAPPTRQLAHYLTITYVAPEPTAVAVATEPVDMLDFRDFRFSALGWAALGGWLLLLGAGLGFAAADRGFRPMALVLAGCFVLNLAIHMVFQYRQSLYLITPHLHVGVFAFLAPLAVRVGAARPALRAGFAAGTLLLALAMAWNNALRHFEVYSVFGG